MDWSVLTMTNMTRGLSPPRRCCQFSRRCPQEFLLVMLHIKAETWNNLGRKKTRQVTNLVITSYTHHCWNIRILSDLPKFSRILFISSLLASSNSNWFFLSPFCGVSPAHLYDKAREGHQEGQAQDGPNLSRIALQISRVLCHFYTGQGAENSTGTTSDHWNSSICFWDSCQGGTDCNWLIWWHTDVCCPALLLTCVCWQSWTKASQTVFTKAVAHARQPDSTLVTNASTTWTCMSMVTVPAEMSTVSVKKRWFRIATQLPLKEKHIQDQHVTIQPH